MLLKSLVWVEVLCWIVYFVYNPSVPLDVPSIGLFVFVYIGIIIIIIFI